MNTNKELCIRCGTPTPYSTRALRSRSAVTMFNTEKPKNESDFNDKIMRLLQTAEARWLREYPILKFGITQYRADGSFDGLIVKSKYLRGKT